MIAVLKILYYGKRKVGDKLTLSNHLYYLTIIKTLQTQQSKKGVNIMKTIRTKVYEFRELSEAAKQKAIDSLYDINVDHGWWEFTYGDAKEIGLKITGFDIGRGNDCTGELNDSLTEVCDKIIQQHGEHCETYKTAQSYLNEWNKLVSEHSDGINTDKVDESKEYEFDQLADELENQFKNSLCEDYLKILRDGYEYLTSKEAIIETIEANEYHFTKDGKMFNA